MIQKKKNISKEKKNYSKKKIQSIEKNTKIYYKKGAARFGRFAASAGWIWKLSKAIAVVHLLARLHTVRILCIQSIVYDWYTGRLLVSSAWVEWIQFDPWTDSWAGHSQYRGQLHGIAEITLINSWFLIKFSVFLFAKGKRFDTVQ